MQSALMQQPPWLALAWAELGEREVAGRGSNPRIEGYIRRVGHPDAANEATPWCAAFVGYCLEEAGIRATGSLLARSFSRWGEAAAVPAPGDVVVLSRGADPALGHVGFLVGVTADKLILLGGNQSDEVSVEAFDRRRLVALRRPPGPVEVGPRAPPAVTPDFEWSLERILVFEGGYSDDPYDPGGPTNKGITLATYARAIGEELTAANAERLKARLRAIPDEMAQRIYLERYWLPACCDRLPAPLAHFHFDAAVNQGVAGAARMLQEALGVAIDGEIGPLTLAAARDASLIAALERYADVRRRRYRALHHFWRFGRGWLARVDKALGQAKERAASPAGSAADPLTERAPPPSSNRETPAMPANEQPSPLQPATAPEAKWWGNSLTIWGALLTALTTVAPAVLAAFGLDIPGTLIERLGRDLITVAQAVAGLGGTIMTIYGRSRASSRIERRAFSLRV